MNRTNFFLTALTIMLAALLTSCRSDDKVDETQAAPPPAKVEEVPDLNIVEVNHPERFTIITAGQVQDRPELRVTGVVNPDIDRSIPVISLASGRVVELDAKLGDDVRKGQLLLKIFSNDISQAFSDYKQAQADDVLAGKQLERARLLYEHGAISQNDYEVAVDSEQKSKAALDAAVEQLHVLGADPMHANPVVNIYAPISGTIVAQNISKAGEVTSDVQPNLFTIADLSHVWVICDVYENDIATLGLGDPADIRLNAYPDLLFHGRITNIGKILDPNIRTAKVRIELNNPGQMRAGMFVTAIFYGRHGRMYAALPPSAILHLHDRDWVFEPIGNGRFRRTPIVSGKITDGQQQILSGLSPSQKVVSDPLAMSAETE